jgi:hypothetical protein
VGNEWAEVHSPKFYSQYTCIEEAGFVEGLEEPWSGQSERDKRTRQLANFLDVLAVVVGIEYSLV